MILTVETLERALNNLVDEAGRSRLTGLTQSGLKGLNNCSSN